MLLPVISHDRSTHRCPHPHHCIAGVIEAAPPGVLSADLSSSAAPEAHAWQLLVHGALPFFIDAVQVRDGVGMPGTDVFVSMLHPTLAECVILLAAVTPVYLPA